MPSIAQKISPFLWFNSNAEEAVEFYTSVFPDSRILQVARYGEGVGDGSVPPGSVMVISFQIMGQRFMAMNGGPSPTAAFNESISLLVHCDTQEEIDRYWDALTSGGGEPIMCGWLKDRFGVRWQITPANFFDWIDKDQATADRVMHALMKMVKLDMAKMQAAADGR